MTRLAHAVRLGLGHKERSFRIAPNALEWSAEGSLGRLPYADVASANLVAYPHPAGRAYECTLKSGSGDTLKIRSLHFHGPGKFEDRTETYTPLVRALLAKLAQQAPGARFVLGNTALFVTWLIIGILAVGVTGLMAVVIVTGAVPLLSALPGFVVSLLLLAICWAQVRKGPARNFDPLNPPADRLGPQKD